MTTAKFVFHGLFPDVITQDDQQKPIAKVLFDVEFEQEFHSHLIADIELIEENNEMFFEVRYDIPFQCVDFANAAIQYYQYIHGPQQSKISHSGPKGASIATHNVVRAEWPVELDATP
jgi:hypothetical protein